MAIIFKEFKFKISRDACESINRVIYAVLAKGEVQDENDMLLLAVLADLSQMLTLKLAKGIMELKIKLTPAQAMALRIFYFDYVNDFTTYEGNKLFHLANKIAKEMGI